MHIWLHIGGEKTGSTSLQHGFAKKRQWLKQHRILYPQSLGERSHLKLYCHASDGPIDEIKGQLGLRDSADLPRFRENIERELRAEITRDRPDVLIISNEHSSSRLFTPVEVGRVHRLLASHSSQITVVFYARPQWELLTSAYSTYVREGGTAPFGMPESDELEAKYNYRRILELWASCFGKANIVVRPYLADALAGGDVVADFCRLTGLPAVSDGMPRHNTSLSIQALEFLRHFNQLVPRTVDHQFNPLRGNIGHLLERYRPEEKLVSGPDLVQQIWEWSEPINRWVSETFLGGGPLFPVPRVASEKSVVERGLSLDQAFQVFAYLWQLKQKQIINAKR